MDEELRDLILDVREVLSGLPQDAQGIAALLSRLKVTEAASEAGVSRGTVYGHRRSLLKKFEKAGLAIYLRRIPRTL
jgi:hypothetical protein